MFEVLVPFFDEIWLSQYASSPRAFPVDALLEELQKVVCCAGGTNGCAGGTGVPLPKIAVFATLQEAVDEARRSLHENDLLCTTGSMYFAAEVRECFLLLN